MSNLYNLEPQPTGKVLLQTTSGDILLELFAKQTPLASRNFLQHCLDGYYDNTIFHRVVPGFIIQGGDPTGTGFGGESVYENGAPFADEFHSRLKFNRRGLLGMANSGDKDDNGSQFFITLGVTPELTGKNTMFGRIEGDTIFNVVKMADADLVQDGSERPLYPTKITGTEILLNPFEDMVRHERVARTTSATDTKGAKKKTKRKVGKALLSFGDDGEELDLPAVKKPKFNVNLVEGKLPPPSPSSKRSQPSTPKSTKPSASAKAQEPSKPIPVPAPSRSKLSRRSPSPSSNSSRSSAPPPKRKDELKKTNAEIAALKASLRRSGPDATVVEEKPKSSLEAMIPDTSTRGRKRGGKTISASEEATALAMFKAFRNKLDTVDAEPAKPEVESNQNSEGKAPQKYTDDEEGEEATLCDLHFIANCQSCSNWSGDDDNANDIGQDWLGHKLSFAKDRLGKDLEWKRKNEEELVVVDPREKARELGVEKVAFSKDGRGGREWDRKRDAKISKLK
jgi:peptidyl-prolyl cis-trans isomerase SDCCAG10